LGFIDVTPEELTQSGHQLKVIAQDLQSAHRRVESLRSAQLGSRRIDSALNHFADHWQYGMRRMVERVDMTGEALLSAGQQYVAVDKTIAVALGQQ
jgi:sRNA-binding protein